jgi:hypothetical protein
MNVSEFLNIILYFIVLYKLPAKILGFENILEQTVPEIRETYG